MVVVVAFLLLMLVFRSLLIPAMASVMNLLSVGAALGVMNAVFGWGWGSSILGISGTAPVEVFIPVIMFSVLFGLSMDYEVFLVSRMHEQWVVTGDNREAVTTGQTETGRVITAAACIMILVFLSFLLNGNIIIQQFGIGLAAAIIVDAFVVRTVLVPALMHLLRQRQLVAPPMARPLAAEACTSKAEPIRPPLLARRSIATGLLQTSGWERFQPSNPATPAHNGRALEGGEGWLSCLRQMDHFSYPPSGPRPEDAPPWLSIEHCEDTGSRHP